MLLYKGRRPILLAHLLTKPAHSIIHQYSDSRLRLDGKQRVNGDGFGVGWYQSESDQESSAAQAPCIFSSVTPAWNNMNLIRLAEKIKSPLVFAHVRGSCAGSVSENNCHPWQFGRLMFMHNGSIADFHLIKRKIQESLPDEIYLSVNGNTDSEWAFAVFLSQLATPRQTEPFCHTVLQDALIRTIRLFNAWSKDAAAATLSNNRDGISPSSSTPSFFNFAVTDGDTVVCTRYVNSRDVDALSLYFSSGTRFECYDTRSGRYKMIKEARREDIVLIASEPLTFEEADWREVPRNSVVVVTSRMNVLTYPIVDEFYEAIPSLATTETETVDNSMHCINTTTVVTDTDMEDIESAIVDKEELQYTQHPEFTHEESSGASSSLSDFSAASMSVASFDSIASSTGTLLSSWPSSPSHHSIHQNQHQQYLVPPLSPSTSSISTESLHLSDVAMHEDRSKVGMMLEKRPRERESTRGGCDYNDGFDSDIEEDYRIFRVRRRF